MDLHELQQIARRERDRRRRIRIHCCTSLGCHASNSVEIKRRLEEAVTAAGLESEIEVVGVGCMGFCGHGPLVEIDPENRLYEHVRPDDAPSIVASIHGGACTVQRGDKNHPFFARQYMIVRKNGGKIDPERIEELSLIHI